MKEWDVSQSFEGRVFFPKRPQNFSISVSDSCQSAILFKSAVVVSWEVAEEVDG